MSLPEVRKYRNMPFLKRGMRANMNGQGGVITSGNSARLRMRFDGCKYSSSVHPTWQMTFYDKSGRVVADYKKKGASA